MNYQFIFLALLMIITIFVFYYSSQLKTIQIYKNEEYEIRNLPRPNVDYMDGVDVIYWINLDRSPDRRIEMTKFFKDDAFGNVPTERISAVDGKLPKLVYPLLRFMHKQKNDYEYACLLSHLETIRKFSLTNKPVALIMEDDLTLELKPYWRKTVQEIIDDAPADWEVIQLCYIVNGRETNPMRFKLYERNIRNKCLSAAAYLISNSAAKKFIKDIYRNGKYNLEHYIIHHADCYIFSKCVTYIYKYPYFIYKTNNDSLLHPEDLGDHELSKMKVLRMFNQLSITN